MPPPTPAEKAELEKLLDKMNLDTGDVVLFDRKCNSMGVYGGVICHSAKLFGQTRWDHNGVIYKTDDGVGNLKLRKLMFLEAAMNGVKLRPLVDRILHSRSYEVRIQKVEVHRTPEFRQRAADFIRRVVEQDIPYEDRIQGVPPPSSSSIHLPCHLTLVLVNAGASFVPSRVDLKRHMKTIQDDLTHRSKMSPFEQNSLRAELASLREQHDALVHQLDQTERCDLFPSHIDVIAFYLLSFLHRSIFENKPSSASDPARFFCSQLVAALYQHVGLLLPYPAATSYRPHNFSDTDDYVKLQSTVVVFYQGDPGDFFYVIADGTVDVLVNYDAYAHEQPKHSVAAEVTAAPVLRRNLSTSFDNPQPTSHFVHVATNGRGNAFGDSALMYQTPRRATVKCAKPVVAYALDKATFASVVKSHPAATQSLSERQFLIQTLANHPLFAHVSKQAQAAAVTDGSTAMLDIFNKTATLHDGDESFLTPTDVAKLLEGDSGVETAQTLLFPSSATTKINFSQFAHFHMCLEAYSSRQFNPLLAEALYRMASYSGSTSPPPFSSSSSTTPSTSTDAPVPFRSLFSLQDVFAAILAGVLARSATAPLERVKLARQVGLLPSHLNLWRSVQHLKRVAGWQRFNAEVKNALAGGSAGVMVQAVLYPLDVVRGRLALQQILQPKATYPTVASCVQAMDGVRSFYRGFGVGTLGVFPYIGLNFAMYEFLRPWLVVQQQHRVSEYVNGGPCRRYTSTWNCIKQTASGGGAISFYRGLAPNIVKALPASVVSFMVYETCRQDTD
ncbi:hypothetical protein DYB35_006119 [Aphanomyces astaci]|uniref:Cyclic nucleotide-binding domain-containing protein n=1 Tax=Aphanomyces astaci TaxID=112090 RepID=A0A418D8T8_APHAT|nr:hypothetical protein DYB35_006119 [Aphanomyces astaci]